jgi:DNA-directed RNA polymerase specialized sigma24 family protein
MRSDSAAERPCEEDRRTFTDFVESHAESILWPAALTLLATRRLPRDLVTEVVQETLLRTWQRWATHLIWRDDEGRKASFLVTMQHVVQEQARLHRKHGRHEELSVVFDRDALGHNVADRALGRIALSFAQEALGSLSDKDRSLIELGMGGASSKEIGLWLEITPESARNRLRRARDRLRAVLKAKGFEHEEHAEDGFPSTGDAR